MTKDLLTIQETNKGVFRLVVKDKNGFAYIVESNLTVGGVVEYLMQWLDQYIKGLIDVSMILEAEQI